METVEVTNEAIIVVFKYVFSVTFKYLKQPTEMDGSTVTFSLTHVEVVPIPQEQIGFEHYL